MKNLPLKYAVILATIMILLISVVVYQTGKKEIVIQQSNPPANSVEQKDQVNSIQNEKTQTVTRQLQTTYSVGSAFLPPANIINLPLYNNFSSTTDTIRVVSPAQSTTVYSPIQVTGYAKGDWFSNGHITVVLTNDRNRVLSKTQVTAQNDWHTNDFVPFNGVMYFSRQTTGVEGNLYFLNQSSSGRTIEAAMMQVTFQ